MSTMRWQGDRIIQGVKDKKTELGYVGFDDNSKTYVLWLKDHEGIFVGKGSYIRGDEWSTMEEARGKACLSVSARLAHFVWMRQIPKKPQADRNEPSNEIQNDSEKSNFLVVNNINDQENHYNIINYNVSNVSGSQIVLNIGKGDSDAFVKELTRNGMPVSDAKDLGEIVSQEKPDDSDEPFGTKASEWIRENLGRLIKEGWKVSMKVGINLLTEAAKKYYGFSSS